MSLSQIADNWDDDDAEVGVANEQMRKALDKRKKDKEKAEFESKMRQLELEEKRQTDADKQKKGTESESADDETSEESSDDDNHKNKPTVTVKKRGEHQHHRQRKILNAEERAAALEQRRQDYEMARQRIFGADSSASLSALDAPLTANDSIASSTKTSASADSEKTSVSSRKTSSFKKKKSSKKDEASQPVDSKSKINDDRPHKMIIISPPPSQPSTSIRQPSSNMPYESGVRPRLPRQSYHGASSMNTAVSRQQYQTPTPVVTSAIQPLMYINATPPLMYDMTSMQQQMPYGCPPQHMVPAAPIAPAQNMMYQRHVTPQSNTAPYQHPMVAPAYYQNVPPPTSIANVVYPQTQYPPPNYRYQ